MVNCSLRKMADNSKVTTGYREINIVDAPVVCDPLRLVYSSMLAAIDRSVAQVVRAILVADHLILCKPPDILMKIGMQKINTTPVTICMITGDMRSTDSLFKNVLHPHTIIQRKISMLLIAYLTPILQASKDIYRNERTSLKVQLDLGSDHGDP
jgi:hypothetical protein